MTTTSIDDYLEGKQALNYKAYLKSKMVPISTVKKGSNQMNIYDIKEVYERLRREIIECTSDHKFKVYDLYFEATKKIMLDGVA